jgi:hypothetical protein
VILAGHREELVPDSGFEYKNSGFGDSEPPIQLLFELWGLGGRVWNLAGDSEHLILLLFELALLPLLLLAERLMVVLLNLRCRV